MTTLEICNNALSMIGIPAITSFDSSNNNAKLCRDLFPVLRDRVLRDHSWSFATKFAVLAPLAQRSPVPEYKNVFLLPGDLLRLMAVNNNERFRKAGRNILSSSAALRIEYIARIEDSSLFDPSFCQALQYLMAAELGMVNTRDVQLVNFYEQKYMQALATARSIDSSENRFSYQSGRAESNWLAARRG